MRIALVPNVPDKTVARRVENMVQRNSQFHRAKIGRKMTPGLSDRFKQERAQFMRYRAQLRSVQPAQIGG
jgi:hypothetical protein